MGKDKARPGSLGARLLSFGRSRIQRYTADGDTPESTAHSETPQQPQQPSVYLSAPPTQPAMPPPSELPPVTPPVTRPQETLPPEARPARNVRRAPRETNAAPESPPPHPEQNAEDRPRQTIGRDLLYILQRHEELHTGQESDTSDSGESFSDASSGSPVAPPSQGRRLGRRPAPPASASPPESPPPGTPMPRRPRPSAEGSAANSAPSAPPNIARTPAPQPTPEPSGDWEIARIDDSDEDTAALYDGDTVRYAQPETPPSAVPRRTLGRPLETPPETPPESRPVQRKPAAQNRDPGGKSRKASPDTTPKRPAREAINRMPEPVNENPPIVHTVPDVQASPHRQESPHQHDLPLIDEADGYEAPLLSDSFELNAGFDLTHQSGTPTAPIQRDEMPPSASPPHAPTPHAPTPHVSPPHAPTHTPSRSPVEHAFTEALPVALPPTRRGRGSIEEFPTQLPNAYEEQPDYDLPYFDEETDRVTEQIDGDGGDNSGGDNYSYREQAAPDIPLMRHNAPPSPAPAFGDDSAQADDIAVDFAAPPTLHRATDDENPYAQDFEDTSEADFESRPDLYEALLRAGMVHSTPPESHDAPIYRAPDPKAAVMPSFEGVYDTDESYGDADEDADTIYNYDDDDESEPEMLPNEESGEEIPFGSVEASLHDLMRYADDESDDESGDESSDYHTTVSFDDEDSDLYDVAFDANADDDSGAGHDDPPSERTPGHMIRRFADAEADLLRLLDLPPDTPVSHGEDSEGDAYNQDDAYDAAYSEDYAYGEDSAYGERDSGDFAADEYADHISATSTPHTNRPRRPAEPPHQPISLADALAAPPSLPASRPPAYSPPAYSPPAYSPPASPPSAPPQTYIAREMDGGDEPAESNGATPTASGETDENKNPSENPDVDKLARDVFRKLRSKLRIEQERRSD